jgi:hypothetical protein
MVLKVLLGEDGLLSGEQLLDCHALGWGIWAAGDEWEMEHAAHGLAP